MRYRLMATYQGVPYEAGIGPADGQVVLFAACPPPEELGFEAATGHWRKQLSMEYIQALWESRPMGRYRGQRCMVLDDLGDRLHIAYIGHDAFQAQELGYWQVDRGVYELVTPREEVTEISEERSDYFPPRSDTGSMPAINTGTMRAISTGNMPAVSTGNMPAVSTGNMPAVSTGNMAAISTGSMPAVSTGPVPGLGYGGPPLPAGHGQAADFGAVTTDFGPAPDYSAPPGFGTPPPPPPGYGSGSGPVHGSGQGRGADPRSGPGRPGPGPAPAPGLSSPGGPAYSPSGYEQKGYAPSAPAGYGLPGQAPGRPGPGPGGRPAGGPGPGSRGGDAFGPPAGEYPVPGGRPHQAPPSVGASPLTSPDYRPAGPVDQSAASGPSALEAAAFRAATAGSHSGPNDPSAPNGPPGGEAVPASNTSGPIGMRPDFGNAVPGDNPSGPLTGPRYGDAGPGGSPSGPIGTRPGHEDAAAASGRFLSRPGDRTTGPAGTLPGYGDAGPGSGSPSRPGDNTSGPIGARPGYGNAASGGRLPSRSGDSGSGMRPGSGGAVPAAASNRFPARPGDNLSGPIGTRPGGQDASQAVPADSTSPNLMAAEPAMAAAAASASDRTPPPAPGGGALTAVGAPAGPAGSVLAPPRPIPPLTSPGGPHPGSSTLAAPALAPPARAPLSRPAPASRPQPGGPLTPDPGASTRPRRRSAQSQAAIRGIFTELASQASISPAAYSVGEEVDGALCLIETASGFEVFSAVGGTRHEVRTFEDEESAYFYLFGVLAAEAVRTGLLIPHR